jgi:hypothetical protein
LSRYCLKYLFENTNLEQLLIPFEFITGTFIIIQVSTPHLGIKKIDSFNGKIYNYTVDLCNSFFPPTIKGLS